jgi:hypothetical protein
LGIVEYAPLSSFFIGQVKVKTHVSLGSWNTASEMSRRWNYSRQLDVGKTAVGELLLWKLLCDVIYYHEHGRLRYFTLCVGQASCFTLPEHVDLTVAPQTEVNGDLK